MTSRPVVLVVAPPRSYRLGAYREAVAGLGLRMAVASEAEHALIAAADHGIALPADGSDDPLTSLLSGVAELPIAGVVATDDETVELASRVAAALGCPHNPPDSVRFARRKDLARERLRDAGLPVPRFRRLTLDRALEPQCAGLDYPCVVKPLSLSGSRGVIRCNDYPGLAAAVRRCAGIVSALPRPVERETLLVESYLPGVEIAVEGLLDQGTLHVLAVFDKPDPLEGPYFEETYYITPSRLEVAARERVLRRVREAAAAYGLTEGPIHAELRWHRGDATVLELAARTIGGECARLLKFGTGQTLEEIVVRHAVGDFAPASIEPEAGAAGVLMIPTEHGGTLRRVEGVLAARRVPLVEDVVISVREGYELTPLPEGSSYLGFVFARGESPAEVEHALRRARASLRVVTAPAWPLLPAGRGIPSGVTS